MAPLPPRCECKTCGRPHYDKAGLDVLEKHFHTCAHCKEPIYYEYVVREEVWKETGLGYHDGVLHLWCLEELIGRNLVSNDFIGPINERALGNSINDAIRWSFHRALGLDFKPQVL